MKKSGFLMVGILAFFLAGCANEGSNWGQKQTVGTVLGAVGGAVAGSFIGGGKGQLVGVAIGTLLGAGIGNSVGDTLDKADALYAQQTAERAYKSSVGNNITWKNPRTGSYGNSRTIDEGRSASGKTCKKVHSHAFFFGQNSSRDNKSVDVTSTACQESNGTWRLVAN